MTLISRDTNALSMLSPLSEYLNDSDVTELRVNKMGQVVTDTRSQGRVFHDRPDVEMQYLKELTNALLNYNGLPTRPVNNLLLPDGSRGIIVREPAVHEGLLLAFRKHLPVTKTLAQLENEGRFKQTQTIRRDNVGELLPFEKAMLEAHSKGDIVTFLSLAVRNHQNIAISGSTNSGKSTLTRSLITEVPRNERLIVMEDVHEVNSEFQDEVCYLQYGDDDDTSGRISPSECLKACMRLTPDRIIMTELRDTAAWDYLSGANTGHPGGIFSTHANSAEEVPERVMDLVTTSPVGRLLDEKMVLKKVNRTLDVIIHMENWNITEILYDPMFKRKLLAA